MSAPPVIAELVERYRNNRHDYVAPNYKEFRLRREFVDPMFEALGWDVSNRGGYAEAYKDVVHEDSIKIGQASKAPDYAFRIGGNRKFFVETKAPGSNLKTEVEPAYQLRRYGWSAKLPLSILTDFEQFIVYDCRIRPHNGDKASVARVQVISFDEYEERWGELGSIFSRDAVLKGSFDRYADDATKKRGTAEVDTAFLAEIETWRASLAGNIALRNAGLSVRELNTAVQRTIDRIIFLRIAEDRGIEPYGRLYELSKGADVYKRLAEFFRQADQRYNSGLFHFKADDGAVEAVDKFTLKLNIDDKVLRDIFSGLYYPESPYEFSVLPADILGQVYEQFLGKVIRLKGRTAVVEEKPEVKKAGGVFYTPTFVVKYIVRKALDPHLEGKTPQQISGGRGVPLRILDPACGSGSFLIEAYQHLLDWYRDKYIEDSAEKHSKRKKATLYRAGADDWRLTIAEKQRILLAHIFGVDIDAQAVEVTKLSLLLKVLEDEKADVIAAQMNLFHMRALPDLGSNIKCGNSLVSHDFFSAGQQSLFSEEDIIKVNAFNWSTEFAFKFDAVVGNPPYGADYTASEKAYFQSKFLYRRGKPETYLFFLEQGFDLLKRNGHLGFIVPNAWLTNFYGVQMRTPVLDRTSVVEVADLEPIRVFKAATVDTCILVLENAPADKTSEIEIGRADKRRVIGKAFSVKQDAWRADPERIFNVYATNSDIKIMYKMQASNRTLKELVDYSQGVIPYKTKSDGKKNLYISSSQKGPGWRPLIESAAQVEPYHLRAPESFINYGKWLWCAREPKYFDEPKILFHRIRKKLPEQLIGAIDELGVVNRHSLSNIILRSGHDPAELWAILALFNSEAVNWWFVKRYGPLMEVGGFKVETIPLPKNYLEEWPLLAAKAKEAAGACERASKAKDGHSKRVHERTVENKMKEIEGLVGKAFGLDEKDRLHIETSYRMLVERPGRGRSAAEGKLATLEEGEPDEG